MISIPKKKGRKSKIEIQQIALLNQQKELLNDDTLSNEEKENKILELKNSSELLNETNNEEKIPKKRGRKPRGGKIIVSSNYVESNLISKHNVILHLKCNKFDLTKIYDNNFESFNFTNQKNELKYDSIFYDKITSNIPENENFFNSNLDNNNVNNEINNYICSQCKGLDDKHFENKNLNKKLDNLIKNFHFNNISDKKTSCFWCTYDFSNPPIYIPKNINGNSYDVYGCFCSPECGCAFLMNENIDNSAKFERYYLLNNIYCKIYNYEKNIKPAPSPFYLLDKFMGSLTIQEYRKLLQNERLLIVIDKPLTPILPELFFENDDFILSNRSIPASM
tara:strand:- start:770 stop:1777 length:1008 start_codon:yes stop_codon:yes gene_type:complete